MLKIDPKSIRIDEKKEIGFLDSKVPFFMRRHICRLERSKTKKNNKTFER